MPSFSQTQWTSCKRWSLEWAAPTGTQPCTVFGYKDFCGSTVLGMPESVGMNGQIDWQAQQISHLVCSLAGQRCSEAWGTFRTLPEHCSTDRLKERGVEKGSSRHSTLQGRERSVFNQTNIGTVLKATLGRLLTRAERWAFSSTTMSSWAETETVPGIHRAYRRKVFIHPMDGDSSSFVLFFWGGGGGVHIYSFTVGMVDKFQVISMTDIYTTALHIYCIWSGTLSCRTISSITVELVDISNMITSAVFTFLLVFFFCLFFSLSFSSSSSSSPSLSQCFGHHRSPSAKGRVWDGLPWRAHTHAQSSAVKTSVDILPWSEGMNQQIDWQTQQTSHLSCSLAGQKCWEAWGAFWTWTGQSNTAVIAWGTEEWRKEAADIPLSKLGNSQFSTRQTLVLFWGQPWGGWEMGPFKALQCPPEQKLETHHCCFLLCHVLPHDTLW